MVHRFNEVLQKHCAKIRLIDIFRSCSPGGDQGVPLPLFIRGFMKKLPMTEDELRLTATALDPSCALTNFVNYKLIFSFASFISIIYLFLLLVVLSIQTTKMQSEASWVIILPMKHIG